MSAVRMARDSSERRPSYRARVDLNALHEAGLAHLDVLVQVVAGVGENLTRQ